MPKDHLPAGAADADVILSVLELPAAPRQTWILARPQVPKGMVTDHHLRSAILGNDHALSVYTPPTDAAAGAPHSLLLLFDRWAYRHFVPTATILDNLLAAGCLAPVVAILVDSPDLETRERELPCSAPFADFLVRELLPWARQRYPLTSDPARIVVGGSSYGGLAAAFAALRHPDVFGNVLSQSGAFWWKPEDDREYEWLARHVAAGPTRPLRFYLEVGLLEAGPMAGNAPDQVVVNRHLCTVLHAKGYPVHYREYNGGHEYVCWRGTLADGLLSLLGRGASARAD
jgi:enterochelin esterase family protein